VTGKVIVPQGEQTAVGSFPNHLLRSPDGRFILVSSSGARSFLSVLDTATGKLVSQVGFNGSGKDRKGSPAREGLYYGLAFGKPAADGSATVYAARGSESSASVLRLAADGALTDTGTIVTPPANDPHGADLRFVAGIALTPDSKTLVAANNTIDIGDSPNRPGVPRLDSAVFLLDADTGAVRSQVRVPAYPFAVTLLTQGPDAGRKAYVGGEQLPVVSVIDPQAGKLLRNVPVGSHPIAFALDKAQRRLFVANANSDTVTVIDTVTDKVTQTILLRPVEIRGLTGATPTGLTLAPDEKTLYVTLGDMNAVAVVDLARAPARVAGYIPVGWYPTSAAVSPDGKRLFVANAKGVQSRVPNNVPFPPAVAQGYRPKYIQSLLEGTVSTIGLGAARQNLPSLTRLTLAANHFAAGLPEAARKALKNPGIEHIIYIVKENRTYDQVLGDLPQGNGDKNLVMFGREVTPNLHALAERFVLLDNFYCYAEVSQDGWNWSVAGMANEFTARNVPYGYTGRNHANDYKGVNGGVTVEKRGIPDAATPENGYIWDQLAKAGISYRNYGFYTGATTKGGEGDEVREGAGEEENTPYKKALGGHTDTNFRQFDLNHADSDAWVTLGLPRFLKTRTYGEHKAPSRISAWRREFDGYVKNNNLPRFQMVRLGNDHTDGTVAGQPSPRAFVADNDYAVGQLVEAVSRSPYWNKTAIFVIEDDAQNGQDHVDAHRSTAYVISPFVRKASVDSRFFNTDSVLHTMECLMGLPPLNQYVAIAPVLSVFSAKPDNSAPFTAILPSKALLSERNTRTAYRAADSARLYDPLEPDGGPDAEMNDILWHAIKGRDRPEPAPRYSLRSLRAKP
jgi:YVTN family beta-propeller protein